MHVAHWIGLSVRALGNKGISKLAGLLEVLAPTTLACEPKDASCERGCVSLGAQNWSQNTIFRHFSPKIVPKIF
jgi:hypothetical protein